MNRDPVTGKFIQGNKVAIGNRGNRLSKWGNENARKHGLFARTGHFIRGDKLVMFNSKYFLVFYSGQYEVISDGRIVFSDDIDTEKLKEMGFNIQTWEDSEQKEAL